MSLWRFRFKIYHLVLLKCVAALSCFTDMLAIFWALVLRLKIGAPLHWLLLFGLPLAELPYNLTSRRLGAASDILVKSWGSIWQLGQTFGSKGVLQDADLAS